MIVFSADNDRDRDRDRDTIYVYRRALNVFSTSVKLLLALLVVPGKFAPRSCYDYFSVDSMTVKQITDDICNGRGIIRVLDWMICVMVEVLLGYWIG